MFGCPVVNSSAFAAINKIMNEAMPNPNPNPNPNPPIQRQTCIVSSLVGDDNINPPIFSTPNQSIKRTFSADMSSPKWLQQNGMKRVQSSDQLHASEDEKKGAAFEDIWSSILSQQKCDGSGSGSGSDQLPPPYVHPLVRRSASSLSEKSLEICTESLGSESGSDGFSFPLNSESEDSDKDFDSIDDQPEQVRPNDEINELGHVGLAKYCRVPPSPNPIPSPRSRSSFPPPLPSLVHQNGSNLHMRSHRKDGRLVLEAVSVPSQNRFRAQRDGGRLLLTLAGDDDSSKDRPQHDTDGIDVEEDQVEQKHLSDNKEDEEEKDGSCLHMEMINVQRSTSPALIKSKFVRLTRTRNSSTWRRNINATVIKEQAEMDKPKSLLPPRPKMARLVSTDGPMSTTTDSVLNAYEYYWRHTTTVAVLKPLAGQQNPSVVPQVEKESDYISKLLFEHSKGKSNSREQTQQEVVVLKAIGTRVMKGDQTREKEGAYLVPFLRGCKEPKRSLLLWEPHCIATS